MQNKGICGDKICKIREFVVIKYAKSGNCKGEENLEIGISRAGQMRERGVLGPRRARQTRGRQGEKLLTNKIERL
jgi:hypothetical protein